MINSAPILHYASIDSTNSQARRLAEQGQTGPVWIIADEQVMGRGRLGREWHSKPGNLYATWLRPLDAPLAKVGQVSLLAALAVHDVASTFAKNASNQLKWPNDCLINGAKFSGILAEVIGHDQPKLCLGIGINVAHSPQDLNYPTTHLGAHQESTTVQATHEVLAAKLEHWWQIWRAGEGFESIKSAWEARALNLGRDMTVDTGGQKHHGIFVGLANDGAMLLQQQNGSRLAVHAGDVRIPERAET